MDSKFIKFTQIICVLFLLFSTINASFDKRDLGIDLKIDKDLKKSKLNLTEYFENLLFLNEYFYFPKALVVKNKKERPGILVNSTKDDGILAYSSKNKKSAVHGIAENGAYTGFFESVDDNSDFIIYNGNLGIGTKDPNAKLDVRGDLYVEDQIRIDSLKNCSGKIVSDNLGKLFCNKDLVNDSDSNPYNEIQNLAQVLEKNNSANSIRISNLADPIDSQDAVTKSYFKKELEKEIKKVLVNMNSYSANEFLKDFAIDSDLTLSHYTEVKVPKDYKNLVNGKKYAYILASSGTQRGFRKIIKGDFEIFSLGYNCARPNKEFTFSRLDGEINSFGASLDAIIWQDTFVYNKAEENRIATKTWGTKDSGKGCWRLFIFEYDKLKEIMDSLYLKTNKSYYVFKDN